MLNQVVHELHNIDLKNLRQICTYFKDTTHLRLNCLFLSPNLHDVEVFRAVADHETSRLQVTEIIYDGGFDPAHEMEWPTYSRYVEEDEGRVANPYIPESDTPESNWRLLDAFDLSYEEFNISRLAMQA